MNRKLNIIALLVGVLGLGSIGLNQADLVEVGPVGQWLAIIASLGLLLWQKLPDRNQDGRPDFFEGFWPWLKARMPWTKAAPVLLACAFAWPALGCSGFQMGVQEPLYSLTDSEDDDAVPDQAEMGLTVTTNKGVNLRLQYVQAFGGLYPATLCVELVTDEGVAFERLCGSCQWAEGVSACRLLPDLGTAE